MHACSRLNVRSMYSYIEWPTLNGIHIINKLTHIILLRRHWHIRCIIVWSIIILLILHTGTIPDSTHSICTACPAGHYCPDPRQPPLPCSNGTYTLPGQNTQCIVCPQGYACHVQDALPLLCSVGSYSPLGSVECLLCPAGAACSNGSLPMPCVSGEYSLQGGIVIYIYIYTTCPVEGIILLKFEIWKGKIE